jgi:hypothetical protein
VFHISIPQGLRDTAFFRIDSYETVMYLEIPITIYTPTEVNKDKLGIYFHGGGMTINKSV